MVAVAEALVPVGSATGMHQTSPKVSFLRYLVFISASWEPWPKSSSPWAEEETSCGLRAVALPFVIWPISSVFRTLVAVLA